MVKCSSDCNIAASFLTFCCFCSASAGICSSAAPLSGIKPFCPLLGTAWDFGSRGVATEEESEDASEGCFVVSFAEVLGDSFKGHDPADGLDNEEDIRQRRRTFHIV